MNLIYLDNAATTKPDEEVLDCAVKVCKEEYFNPSALYREGMAVKKVLLECENDLLSFYKGRNVIFTSCGTESDNTAIFSFAKHGNIVTTLGEHSAVYKTYENLKQKGVEVRYASLDYGGGVNERDLLEKVDEKTSLVSVAHVNNETGAINDIARLAKLVKQKSPRCVFMSDGVQGFCKIPVALTDCVDVYTFSAHKIKALKGVGGLLYTKKTHIAPYVIGGGQQNGLRSGTENVLGIYALAKAFKKYVASIDENFAKASALKKIVVDGINKELFKIISPENGSPYIVCLAALKMRGAVLQNMLDDEGVVIGTGSACNSKSPHSRVIFSFEKDKSVLDGVIRLSFSFDTTPDEVKKAVEILNEKAKILYGKINL